MRIIAGQARRTALEVAPGSSTRPFLEMARGALFNSLGDATAGAAALDLYAGSGALGLEALSRGAASCVFVERDPAAHGALRRNIAKCRMESRSRALRMDVGRALEELAGPFGLVFVDPPFPELGEWREGGRAGNVMRGAARLLAPDGVVVFRIEEGRGMAPPAWPDLVLTSDRRYGRSRVCRYGKNVDQGGGA